MEGTVVREPVPQALDGQRVDRVVAMLSGVARSEAARLVSEGRIRLDGREVEHRSRRVSTGEVLELALPEARGAVAPQPAPEVSVNVVYFDEHVVVVNKQAGLVVHPGPGHSDGTLVNALLARFPDMGEGRVGDGERPGIVHRLDAGTSGLMVVARNAGAYASLVAQLAARSVDRRYLALVWGHVEAPAGVIDAPIGRSATNRTQMAVVTGGRTARTRYKVLERFSSPAPLTLLECHLETGRTHQVRVHLASIGHAVAGDARYRGRRPVLSLDRPFLHAWQLAFEHPGTGEVRRFECPLPEDLEVVRAQLA